VRRKIVKKLGRKCFFILICAEIVQFYWVITIAVHIAQLEWYTPFAYKGKGWRTLVLKLSAVSLYKFLKMTHGSDHFRYSVRVADTTLHSIWISRVRNHLVALSSLESITQVSSYFGFGFKLVDALKWAVLEANLSGHGIGPFGNGDVITSVNILVHRHLLFYFSYHLDFIYCKKMINSQKRPNTQGRYVFYFNS